MNRYNPPETFETDIRHQLEQVLESTEDTGLEIVEIALNELPDRWYGRFLGGVVNSIRDSVDRGQVLPAAVSIELLRGYCYIRWQQLFRRDASSVFPNIRDPSVPLLMGDYLHSAAYSQLDPGDRHDTDVPYAVFIRATKRMTERFYSTITDTRSPEMQFKALLDISGGVLGQSAADLGARLAQQDVESRHSIRAFGRVTGAYHAWETVLETGSKEVITYAPGITDEFLEQFATEKRQRLEETVKDLPATVSISTLRKFADIEDDIIEQC